MDIFNKPDPTAPEPEVEQRMTECSAYVAAGEEIIDRRENKSIFASTSTAGSSAIYAKDGGTLYLEDARIHGYGAMTDEDMRNELASKYGFCAAVLANVKTSHVTLVNPKIVCHEGSNANGAYAIFGGAVTIKGGTIDTDCRLGHGVDCSYGGHIYCDGTVIHTKSGNSGALATDFQGGYITVRNIKATTEFRGSPGIYTAGKSIITAYDSKFVSNGCEGVMIAHTLGHTYLYDSSVTGTVGLNSHNGMGEGYSYLHMYDGKLTATEGSLLMCEEGRAIMNLDNVRVGGIGNGKVMDCTGGGKLIANMRNMNLKGDVDRQEKSYTEMNLMASSLEGAVNATVFTVDEDSKWKIGGDSKVAVLSIAEGAKITLPGSVGETVKELVTKIKPGEKAAPAEPVPPVVVTYGKLTAGTILPEIEGVVFVQDESVVDDFEEKKMGPPPGMPMPEGGAPGGMPPM